MGKRTTKKTQSPDQCSDISSSDDQSNILTTDGGDQTEDLTPNLEELNQRSGDGRLGVSEVLSGSPHRVEGHNPPVLETTDGKICEVITMPNVSFIMVTIDRKKSRPKAANPNNYIEQSIKSIQEQKFPTCRKLYVYDDGSDPEYYEKIPDMAPFVECYHYDDWGADKLRHIIKNNGNSYHVLRSLYHHIHHHEPTEWVCLMEDDIEMVKNAFPALAISMINIPKKAWTATCFDLKIQHQRRKIQVNSMWALSHAYNYPNNVFVLLRRKMLEKLFEEDPQLTFYGGGADIAIKAFMFRNKMEPNYALRENICQHIGDFSSVGNMKVRRAPDRTIPSNLLIYAADITNYPLHTINL